jgi:hypothetical protein
MGFLNEKNPFFLIGSPDIRLSIRSIRFIGFTGYLMSHPVNLTDNPVNPLSAFLRMTYRISDPIGFGSHLYV